MEQKALEIINADDVRAYDKLLREQIVSHQKRKRVLSGLVIASAGVLLAAVDTENDWVKTAACAGLVGGALGVATLQTVAPDAVSERQKLAAAFRGNRTVFVQQRQ